MIHFSEYVLESLSTREDAKQFCDVAVEEYLTDGDLEALLLSMHYLIESHKKRLDSTKK